MKISPAEFPVNKFCPKAFVKVTGALDLYGKIGVGFIITCMVAVCFI